MRHFLLLALLTFLSACANEADLAHEEAPEEANQIPLFGRDKAPFFRPGNAKTKFPIVLAHGFNASSDSSWSFNLVAENLRLHGNTVVEGDVPPFADIPERAGHLKKQIEALLLTSGADKVHLICHSQGGLDCRFVASPGGLDMGDQIASVTTISTPHHGGRVADRLLKLMPEDREAKRVVNCMATLWGKQFSDKAESADLVRALTSMKTSTLKDFNERVTDHKETLYQSYAGVSFFFGLSVFGLSDAVDEACEGTLLAEEGVRDSMDLLLMPVATLIAGDTLMPNDGVISVESAKWGTFRGCIPADHMDEIGQIDDHLDGREIDGVTHVFNPDTGFNYQGFYRSIASDLAKKGL